jgi:hypothetical protein
MKLAIVGTRELSGLPVVEKAVKQAMACINSGIKWNPTGFTYNPKDEKHEVITEVVSGGARGVDRLAELYAAKIGVPCKVFEPKKASDKTWVDQMMKARNQEIVNYADAMVAIRLPDQSPGTDDAILRMKAAGKPVVVFDLRPIFVEHYDGNSSISDR